MDYAKELAKIDKYLQMQRYRDAGQLCGMILQTALKEIYEQFKNHARPDDVKVLFENRENISTAEEDVHELTLDQLIDLFQETKLLGKIGPVLGKPIQQSPEIQFQQLLGITNRCSIPIYLPPADEIKFFYSKLNTLLSELDFLNKKSGPCESTHRSEVSSQLPGDNLSCPNCGEPVGQNWKICPVCETPLGQLKCPRCRRTVKEKWKRCPECTARLICSSCGRRMQSGEDCCPDCRQQDVSPIAFDTKFIDPITGMEFIFVVGGRFVMGDIFGDGIDNETPVHEVQLDGFYLGKYPVTQGQWKQVMGNNPAMFKKSDSHPVEQVDFEAVQAFISKLTQLHHGKYRFRLPTEAEWEYAARSGGRDEKYAGGDNVDAVAWYEENSDGSTHAVGQKAPNGLGIFDMSGNVWEWCEDTFRIDAYQKHRRDNPVLTGGGPDRVIRGGSWNLDSWSVRCSRRLGYATDYFGAGLGFRLVRVP